MSNNGLRINWPMRIASILLCLVLFTTYFSAGLYARYTAKGTGSDEARVAKFTVDVDSGLLKGEEVVSIDFTPGETDYVIEIENKSEVAVNCTIQVTNVTKNIPMTFCFDDNPLDHDGIASSHGLAPNSTENINFTVNWTANEEALNYMGMVDLVKITLNVEQID